MVLDADCPVCQLIDASMIYRLEQIGFQFIVSIKPLALFPKFQKNRLNHILPFISVFQDGKCIVAQTLIIPLEYIMKGMFVLQCDTVDLCLIRSPFRHVLVISLILSGRVAIFLSMIQLLSVFPLFTWGNLAILCYCTRIFP